MSARVELEPSANPVWQEFAQGASSAPQTGTFVNLRLEEIQGNCLGGFLKDNQAMLFLRVKDAAQAKRTLIGNEKVSIWNELQGSTSEQVIRFNHQFKELKSRGVPEGTISATWTNLVFTFEGLKALGLPEDELENFPKAFRDGMRARAARLGDTGVSGPANWDPVVDWDNMHAVIVIASDDAREVDPQNDQSRVRSYLRVIQQQDSGLELAVPNEAPGTLREVPQNRFQGPGQIYGATRANEPGHEHFGFKDGVSQPGIRGLDLPDDPVSNPNQGNPGQDLLYAGEFVIGYNRQIPLQKPDVDGPNPDPGLISGSGEVYDPDDEAIDPLDSRAKLPDWAMNGSFMVFRRLEQDVAGFREHVSEVAAKLGISPDLLGAKLVGRYRSGAPLEFRKYEPLNGAMHPPMEDPGNRNPALGNDDAVSNNFEYGDDENGDRVPLAAHIRKAYPRDQFPENEAGRRGTKADAESRTQTHRLLRRGIPYGASLWGGQEGDTAGDPRGLLFIAYQSDIERQFEFVQANWVNTPDFPQDGAGRDPIISPRQTTDDASSIKGCPFHPGGQKSACPVSIKHFVSTRGGGYFFSPSIFALHKFLGL